MGGQASLYIDGHLKTVIAVVLDMVYLKSCRVRPTSSAAVMPKWGTRLIVQRRIGDIKIYNYGITPDEVADLYAGHVGSFCRNANPKWISAKIA